MGIYINAPIHTIILGEALDLKIRIEYPAPYLYSLWHGKNSLFSTMIKYEDYNKDICYVTNLNADYLAFIKSIYRKNPQTQLHVITTNSNKKFYKETIDWISSRRFITCHNSLNYKSWINQVEIWLRIFLQDLDKDGIFNTKKEFVEKIILLLKRLNSEKALPFSWSFL